MDRFCFSIFQFCQNNHLISDGDKVLISISGGADSMGVFKVLQQFKEKIRFDLHLIHFHHGLRPESDAEELFIKDLANKTNTPLTIRKACHLKGVKGMQNRAREWRYKSLLEVAEQIGANKIALGHHLDDLMETQIWKLIRGGSLFTLNPMQAFERPYIRPFLETPKQQIKDYLSTIEQPWCEDASNQSLDYTRNVIRNKIIPLMQQCSGGNLSEKFLYIDKDARELRSYFSQLIKPETYQADTIDFSLLQRLNKVFAGELLHQFLLFHEQEEITRKNINKILDLVQQNKGNWKVTLKNGFYVFGHKKVVSIRRGDIFHRPKTR